MNKSALAHIVLCSLCLSYWSACNDPSTIGSELLEADQANVLFTDTLTMVASSIPEDSVLVYDPDPAVSFSNYLFGDYEDPLFGTTKASFYAQLILNFDPPDFEDAELDSVVLVLDYDSTATYGNINSREFGLDVYRITEDVDLEERYYSDQTFEVESSPMASIASFKPRLTSNDSVEVINFISATRIDTVQVPPQLRIQLPLELGEEFIAYDDDVYTSNTNFVEQFRGIYVTPTQQTDGIIGFDIANPASRLTVYYRQDTVFREYTMRFSSSFLRTSNFEQDFTGSVAEPFLESAEKGDSLLFAQAMAGPNIELEIPHIRNLDGIVVNKAELELTVAVLPEDGDNFYASADQMIIAYEVEGEGQVFIRDVISGGLFFGGTPEDESVEGEIVERYRMNISDHIQDMLEGDVNNTITIRIFPKQEIAERTVIYGPGHSEYPMKLNVTYTKLRE